jgi:hypothetical protein
VRDPWTVLELPPDADEAAIRRAYRKLVKVYHPDVAANPQKAAKNSRKLEEIMEAYQRLLTRRRPFAGRPVSNPRATGGAHTGAGRPRTHGTEPKTKATGSAGREGVDPSRWARYGELLISGRNAAIRAAAAKTLGDLGRRASYGYLRQAFSDPDDRVVCEAVRAVGRIRVRQAKGELMTLFSRGSPAVKHAVLDCVEELGELEDYGSLLYSALKDPYASVRQRGVPLMARYQKVREHAGKKS